MHMMIQGKATTLSWWLEALPDDLIRARPWLSVHHAWTQYWIGHREQAEEYVQSAERALRDAPPAEAERRRIAGYAAVIRAYNALVNEEIARTSENAQRALELLPEGEYVRCLGGIILGGANWGLGNVVAAERAFDAARVSARQCGYRFLAASAACYVGMQQAKQGRLHEAAKTYREALRVATESGGPDSAVSGFPAAKLGDLSREWNDLESASRYLGKGVERCVQWGQADVVIDSHVALARLQLAQGDLERASDSLQKAERLAQQTKTDPWITCWLDDCRLRLWLAAGDLDAAVRWAQASGMAVGGELSYQHDLHHVNLARVLVARGTRQPSGPYLDEALGLLARLLKAARAAAWTNEAIKILILQALALQAQGHDREALTALIQALTLAEAGGYTRTFIDEGLPMGRLLSQVLDVQDAPVGYANRLLAALERETREGERAQPSLAPLVEPLSKRELEVLRLIAAHMSRTEIARELFISVNTVRSHIKNIYGKLGVHKRKDAIQRARDLGLL
jgi:LuxR family maltose regulon positive regulatory protein